MNYDWLEKNIHLTLFRNLPDVAVFVFDDDLCYTFAEGADLVKMGLSPQVIVGKSIWEIYPPVHTEALEPLYRAALRGKEGSVEGRYKEHSYRVTAGPFRNDQGEIVGGIVVTRDVTYDRQREKALRDRERRYRMLFEQTNDAVFIMDLDGIVLEVNGRAAEMFGYPAEELVGLSFRDLVATQETELSADVVERMKAGEVIEVYERTFRKKDGSTLLSEINVALVRDERDRPLYIQSVVRDITLRKQREIKLRESEERYRILTELISDFAYAYRVDPDGSAHREWMTEESFQRISGFSSAELEGKSTFALWHPDDVPSMLLLRERVKRGETVVGEHRLLTKSGDTRWMRVYRQPVFDEIEQRVVRFYGLAEDITERKMAEIALRRSEELLNQTQQIAKVGGWELDLGTGELIWTQHTREIHEVPEDYVPNLANALDFYAPEHRSIIQRAVERGFPYDLELMLITAGGRRIWVRTMAQAEMMNEQVVRLYGTFQDITERKEAEMALRQSEERYRSLTDLISDFAFSFIITPDGTLTLEWLTEESYTRITGYTPLEAAALGRTGLYHPEDRPRAAQAIEDVLAGQSSDDVYRIITKQGEERWLQIGRRPTWDDAHQRVVRFYGVAKDITEHKEAEEALRRNEERFRLIAQASHDGLYDFDVIQENVWLSKGYVRLFGLGKDPNALSFYQLVEMWYARIHPDDQVQMRDHGEQIVSGERSHWSIEYRFRKANGRYMTLSDRGYVIPDEDGRTERIIGAVTDVTQQREAEKRTLELTLAREKMKLFAEFITAISHDFRNPLAVINTSLYLIERTDEAGKHQRQVEQLREQAQRIAGLVDGLLMMTQLDSPDAFEFEKLNVNDLLNYIEIRERGAFAANDIHLTVTLADDLPPVRLDRRWMYTALLNLMENARLYTLPGGSVNVRTYILADYVVVEIADTGIGIEHEHMSRIFDPLYRIESHRPATGQGLGLSVAQKVVEHHNGYILAESEVGQGSIFRVSLPIPEADTEVS